MHDHDYINNLNVGSERLVTKNLPAGTYRKAKISSVDVDAWRGGRSIFPPSLELANGKGMEPPELHKL